MKRRIQQSLCKVAIINAVIFILDCVLLCTLKFAYYSTQCKHYCADNAEVHRKWSAETKDGYIWILVRVQNGDMRTKWK